MRDNGESIHLFEPLRIPEESKWRGELSELALELARRSEGFRRSLPDSIASSLADLVRSMNCYYSNLIEGHDTHPVDIERALNRDFSDNHRMRDLQEEARAHIVVQQWIDGDGLAGSPPTSPEGIREIHRRFCELLPRTLLQVDDPATGEPVSVVPGAYRDRFVKVGRHVAVSPGAIPRFMERFDAAYSRLRPLEATIAAAAAHHRLLWIHPFMDGNGRVVRLMSHAMLRRALSTGSLWSASRGLARRESEYKQRLAACDQPKRNDLDGRGTLSEEELAAFTGFFLETCIDQVDFMERLMQPDRLRDRIMIWTEEQIRAGSLPPQSDTILRAVLTLGELGRGEVAGLLGTSDRTARRITSALVDAGVLKSASTRAPLRLAFPAKLADRWMPGLFPER